MVSWHSRKQHLVTNLTCYAKYIVLHKSSHEAIFLQQLLDSLIFPCYGSTPIYCDNNATTHLEEDQVLHSKVKHIRVKLHTVMDAVCDNTQTTPSFPLTTTISSMSPTQVPSTAAHAVNTYLVLRLQEPLMVRLAQKVNWRRVSMKESSNKVELD